MNTWTRIGFVALCGVLGAGCLSETRYVCPPGSDITASTRCGAACASGELSASECVEVRAACADGRLTALDCAGIDGDIGVQDMGMDQGEDAGPDGDVVETGVDAGPCPPCLGDTPVCDMDSRSCVECIVADDCNDVAAPHCNSANECVQCLDEDDCGGLTPACLSGTCVGCVANDDCPATAPRCDTSTNTCSDCTGRIECFDYATTPACGASGECVACDVANESADCGDTPATPVCNMATEQCVQCVTNFNCTNVTASRCTGNSCTSCMNDTHCSHLSATPRCFGGTCRECNPATEAADCDGESCNPATRTCSGIPLNSRTVCQQCVSDSDCSQVGGTFGCIAMNYMGTPKGGYCMRASPGCTRPFLTPIMAPSLSGAAMTTYCGIDQTLVSCEAVNALRGTVACPGGNASECMADGALCETVGLADNQCTYMCGNMNDCLPTGSAATCGAGYCGS